MRRRKKSWRYFSAWCIKNYYYIKYFVICSASNPIQVKSITDNIRDNVKEDAWRIEGYENLNWVIIDYIDVVVHIFFDEIRQYYNIERIWFDAKKVEIKWLKEK